MIQRNRQPTDGVLGLRTRGVQVVGSNECSACRPLGGEALARPLLEVQLVARRDGHEEMCAPALTCRQSRCPRVDLCEALSFQHPHRHVDRKLPSAAAAPISNTQVHTVLRVDHQLDVLLCLRRDRRGQSRQEPSPHQPQFIVQLPALRRTPDPWSRRRCAGSWWRAGSRSGE